MLRYGSKVEQFLEVYLKTPGLPQEEVTKALLARGTARRVAAERLMTKANQGTGIVQRPFPRLTEGVDIHVLSRLDPSNRQVKSLLQLTKQVRPFRCAIDPISFVLSPTSEKNQHVIAFR